jgi:hypothetical protein
MRRSSWVAPQLAASREGLSYMELVSSDDITGSKLPCYFKSCFHEFLRGSRSVYKITRTDLYLDPILNT